MSKAEIVRRDQCWPLWHARPVHIRNAADAALLLGPALGPVQAQEALAVAYLDADRCLLDMECVQGEADLIDLPVRNIIARALNLRAAGLVLAHSHPSGNPAPSNADLTATRRLTETATAVGVQLHDHLIFAGGDCRSMRALGLL